MGTERSELHRSWCLHLGMPLDPSTWLRHRDVVAHLHVDPKTLRARMAENPPHLEPPWINVGSLRRPDYRWRAEGVDAWWIAVNRWRSPDPTAPPEHPQSRRPRAKAANSGSIVAMVRAQLKDAA